MRVTTVLFLLDYNNQIVFFLIHPGQPWLYGLTKVIKVENQGCQIDHGHQLKI